MIEQTKPSQSKTIRKVLYILLLFSACAKGKSEPATESSRRNTTPQVYNIGGSTTVDPIIQLAIESWRAEHPNDTISYDGVGSSNGIKGVLSGSYLLGGSSRELKDSETAAGIRKTAIALDGIAVVTHKSTGITSLAKGQIQDIFSGKITNWQAIGGSDAPITLFIREESSGTRDSFDELALDKNRPINSALVVVSNGDMALKLSSTPHSIGYIGIGYIGELGPAAHPIEIDGYLATEEAIAQGDYALARPLFMVYTGELNGFKKAFMDYLLSPEGQDFVVEAGFLPIPTLE
ncbi:MAG: phosphate ABC transporter substrate-binding protein [Spirochaetota bacterium]